MIVRNTSKYLQFKNTISVIQWFNQIMNKAKFTFIQFDICDFYSSISKQLLSDSLEWAETMTTIGSDQKEIIFHVRKSFLFNQKQPYHGLRRRMLNLTLLWDHLILLKSQTW